MNYLLLFSLGSSPDCAAVKISSAWVRTLFSLSQSSSADSKTDWARFAARLALKLAINPMGLVSLYFRLFCGDYAE